MTTDCDCKARQMVILTALRRQRSLTRHTKHTFISVPYESFGHLQPMLGEAGALLSARQQGSTSSVQPRRDHCLSNIPQATQPATLRKSVPTIEIAAKFSFQAATKCNRRRGYGDHKPHSATRTQSSQLKREPAWAASPKIFKKGLS